ncbi:MAG TPA: MerR family transcriptional regulator [Pseudolabrys sp.]|nr:MerR family transcriptional regulator [Pseudolabrys sp.]
MDHKAPEAFRSISEVAAELDLPQHVLRFWESRFHDIRPMKRGGGRRYYRPEDVNLLRGIRHLLYGEGYTIRGVQRILREEGAKFVAAVWQEGAPQPPHGATEDEDFAEEAASAEAEAVDEARGIGSRLSALIGRDLGDRGDDVEARRDPPLKGAPEPRVEPTDRAIHGAGPGVPSPASAAPPIPAGRLGREDVRKLHAALHELAECRKLIEAAVAHEPRSQ